MGAEDSVGCLHEGQHHLHPSVDQEHLPHLHGGEERGEGGGEERGEG